MGYQFDDDGGKYDYDEIRDSDTNDDIPQKRADIEEKSQYDAEMDLKDEFVPEENVQKEKTLEDNGPSPYTTNDRWAETDTLGYWVYVDAIYNFLIHPQTTAPLTISVQAPWGGGKTSIMRMVQSKLDHTEFQRTLNEINGNVIDEKNSESLSNQISKMHLGKFVKILKNLTPKKIDFKINDTDYLTVWFSAWKYDSTKQVWAGLTDVIIRQLTDRLQQEQREEFWLLVNKDRIDSRQIKDDIDQKVHSRWIKKIKRWVWIPIVSVIALFPTNFVLDFPNIVNTFIPIVDVTPASLSLIESMIIGFSSLYVALLSRTKSSMEVRKEPASTTLKKFIEIPDYGKDAGYIHKVDEDLRRILKIIRERYNKPIIIFIDDLDRCSPTRVAEVIESVNRFLSAEFPGCFFVLGMDPELVAAALEEHHAKVLEKLPKHAKQTPLGWRFMDKFVQLPVVLPPPEQSDRDYYVETLIGSKLKEKKKEYELKAKKAREKALEQSKEYSDDNELVKKSIKDNLGDFSDNPRELKRFINLYRFYYFLSTLRKERQTDLPNLKIPSSEQITNWIKLTLKWPTALRWILRSSGETGFKIEIDGISTQTVENRLITLEKLAELGAEKWQENLKKLLEFNDGEYVSWIEDEDLRRHIIKSKFSEANGVGFF